MHVRRSLATVLSVGALFLAGACAGDDLDSNASDDSSSSSASGGGPVSISGQSFPEAALMASILKDQPQSISSVSDPSRSEPTLFALEHADEFARQAAVLRAERSRLQAALAELPPLEAFTSEANMILVRVPGAARVFTALKEHGVLVKHVAGLHPLLADCLRLTVGTPEENTHLLEALRASLPAPLPTTTAA